jgi:apolipoprotein N-acyltransferase
LIRLVQPNIAQSDKWRSDNAVRIFEDMMVLSARPSVRQPDVIIWPESSLPFLLDESPEALNRIGDMLSPGQSLLAGSIRRERDASCKECPERYFTSILAINDAGLVVGRYDKWRLVPGGEYLPLAWLLEPMGFRKVVNLPESFSAGPGPLTLNVAGIGPAAMLICYEVIFPHQLVPDEERPRWIVNVTNDGWFGKSVGPYQHLAQVRMRAVEQGVPVARAANTGISALIDSKGRVLAQSTLELRDIVESGLPGQISPTFYARLGDYCLLLLVIAIFSTSGFIAYLLGSQFTRK